MCESKITFLFSHAVKEAYTKKGVSDMRREQTYEFTQEEFLKRLGFDKDTILVEIFTFQFMEDQRKIKVRVNRDFPEDVKKKSP